MYKARHCTITRIALWAMIATAITHLNTYGVEIQTTPSPSCILNIAVDGSDMNDGSSENPLATLQAALEKGRALRQKGVAGTGIEISISAGTYYVSNPLVLSATDSGTPDAPLIIKAKKGGIVVLTGAQRITGWKKVSAADTPFLKDSVAGKIFVATISSAGPDLSASMYKVSGNNGTKSAIMNAANGPEIICNGEIMQNSRIPDRGYEYIDGLPLKDKGKRWSDMSSKVGVFNYRDTSCDGLQGEKGVWAFGYWGNQWACCYQVVDSVHAEKKTITLAPPHSYYPYINGSRFAVLNSFAGLDSPGEWKLDAENAKIYFFPPRDIDTAVVSITSASNIITIAGASNIMFGGCILEGTRGTPLIVTDSEKITIFGCTVRNTGNWGVVIDGGKDNMVYGCDISHTAEGGIALIGGTRFDLVPSGHVAENNYIHHFARLYLTYRPGILMSGRNSTKDGCGHIARRNLICHAPHEAIEFWGNDHLIEGNEIYSVTADTGDCGAIYTGRDWSMRGTIIRGNFLHHIFGGDTGSDAGKGIYLDDGHAGITIEGNLFWKVFNSFVNNCGRDNTVENNLFVDCISAICVSAAGLPGGWMRKFILDTLPSRVRAMPYQSELWQRKYPRLAFALEDSSGAPNNIIINRNICLGGKWDGIPSDARPYVIPDNNNYIDETAKTEVVMKDNLPAVDIPAPALQKTSFKPISFEAIGVYADPRRASWPVKRFEPLSMPVIIRDAGIVNGTFETGEGTPEGWHFSSGASGSGAEVTLSTDGLSGSTCVHMNVTDANEILKRKSIALSQTISCKERGRYWLSFDLKTKGIQDLTNDYAYNGFSALVHIKYMDGSDGPNLGRDFSARRSGDVDWHRVRALISIPYKTAEISVTFEMKKAMGEVWIDNVKFERSDS